MTITYIGDKMISSDLRPFLKWAGGKRHLEEYIIPKCPAEFGTYYEPFLGSGAILFALHPRRAVINDLNGELMITYSAIKHYPDEVIENLKDHEKNDSKEYFYYIRHQDRKPEFNVPDIPQFGSNNKKVEYWSKEKLVGRAARLIYLNKASFNGLYRVNSRNQYNTPYTPGHHKICDEDAIRSVSKYLRSNDIEIRNTDFADAVKDAQEGDFIYFDPPYANVKFTGYQADKFNDEDQLRLRDLVVKLTDKNVRCLISNSDTFDVQSRYGNKDYFEQTVIESYVSMGRIKVKELLISNKIDSER